jgi:hypothetical protein
VYTLGLLNAFFCLPSWSLSLRTSEWLQLLSYVFLIAFAESSVQCVLWVVLYALLPVHWFRDHFVSQCSLATVIFGLPLLGSRLYPDLVVSTRLVLLGGGLCLALIAASWIRVCRFEPLERIVASTADRLSVLLYLYVPLTATALVYIVLQAI